jgi:glycosyltransferase involved in cell wall biosynthesis
MASVILAEQFFHPDGWGGAQIPRDIAGHLVRAGFDVSVVCGSDPYAKVEVDSGVDPRRLGVRVLRVPRLLPGDIHSAKLLRQLWFYLLAGPILLTRRRPSALLVQTNPPLLVPLAAFVALLRRTPLVIIAQDLYPEVMFAHGMARPDAVAGRLLARLFRWAFRRATKVVALGETMAQRLVQKGVARDRIEIISNWATGDESIVRGRENELRAKWGLEGKFVILYSGNIGIAHDVETCINALPALLRHSPDVRLVFIGKGSRLTAAQRAAADARVEHAVQFHPLVPASLLPHSLGLADVAIVTLREGFEGLVVPSKALGYMARGVPTLYVGPPSDIEQILLDSAGGVSVRNGDAAGMARLIETLIDRPERLETMGLAAQSYYESHLSRTRGLARYVNLIDSVLSKESREPDARIR